MPIRPPALDDRSFDDLVDEALARIPAHTPEWTNPRPGDPGRTLIDLFAWLTDTLLYRANLIPERQRLAFLRLLGIPMRPALPARGIVAVGLQDKQLTTPVYVQPLAGVSGPPNFETTAELTVLPTTAQAYYKRALNPATDTRLQALLPQLQQIYQISGAPQPYATTPVFPGGLPDPAGFDLISQSVDKCLWLALFVNSETPTATLMDQVKSSLKSQLVNIGVAPALQVPALFEDIGPAARIPHVWEISYVDNDRLDYLTLDVVADSTEGLTQRGVIRLALPGNPALMGAPGNDVRRNLNAGVGDSPPRIDDPKLAARLIAWLRLRPTERLQSLSLSWVGINAVAIDQRTTLTGRVVGVSDGSADQGFQLPGQSVEPDTLEMQVEEEGRGYQPWLRLDDLALAGRDASVYSLDSEAGTVRFGDGVRGRIPDRDKRIRVKRMRAGGGQAGNLPPGTLKEIQAPSVTVKLVVTQSLPTDGGEDAETIAAAEQRIPDLFRHGDRAVTESDYRRLAAVTPGVRVGRVEVMPRFKPQQRRDGVPGVVSVMVLPFKAELEAPNPRPDRPFLETVHAYLDRRRPLSTELYVIGCDYVPIGVSVAVGLRSGFTRDAVLNSVRDALRQFLWPLTPGGPDGTGWPRGGTVRDRELEVVVARVAGVSAVAQVNLFARQDSDWRMLARDNQGQQRLDLDPWQLPELLSLVAVVGDAAPDNLRGVPNPFEVAATSVAVPVVPEVC